MRRNIALLLVVLTLFINNSFTALADASWHDIESENKQEVLKMNVEGRNLQEVLPDFKFFRDPSFSVSQESGLVNINTSFDLIADFVIEEKFFDQIKAGDYLEYSLSEHLEWPESLKEAELQVPNQIEDEDGNVEPLIFTLKLVDGALRIVFSDLNHDDHGWEDLDSRLEGGEAIKIKVNIDKEKVIVPQEIVIKNPLSDEDVETIFIKPEKLGNHIEKKGFHQANQDLITWSFDLNKGYENLIGAELKDTLPPYLKIIEESVALTELELDFNLNEVSSGNKIEKGYSIEYDKNLSGFKLIFDEELESAQTPKRLIFKTSIDEEALREYDPELFKKYFLGAEFKVKNTGDLTFVDKDSHQADAMVNIVNAPMLEKKMMSNQKLDKDHLLKWEINFNNGGKYLEKPIITDSISDNLEFVKNGDDLTSIFKLYNEKGEDVSDLYDWYVEANDEAQKEVKIIFDQDIEDKIVIKYETKVTKDFIVSDENISNTASYLEYPTKVNKVINDNLLVKSRTAYDEANKTINWQIKVNQAGYTLEDLLVFDKLAKGLSFIEESLEIKTLNGHKLQKDQDYLLTVEDQKFVIKFINDYKFVTETMIINYQTAYDIKLVESDVKQFSNHVSLKWEGGSAGNKIEKTVNHQPDHKVINNGLKTGSYNYRDKKIQWEVLINYNQEEGPIEFEDIIENQKVEAVDIYEYKIENNAVKITSENLNRDIKASIVEEGKRTKVSIKFEEGKQYKIVITTSVADGIIQSEYENNAKFITKDGKEYPLKAKINIKGGGSHGEKSGKAITSSNKDLFEWKVDINKAQSRINNVVVHDEPSQQQEILKDSFILYIIEYTESGKIAKREKVDESLYDLKVFYNEDTNKDSFELSFKDPIENSYELFYQTRIHAQTQKETLENKITVNGEQEDFKVVEVEKTVEFTSVEISGGVTIPRTTLKVKKIDAANEDKPVSQAVFKVERKTKNGDYVLFMERAVTDEEGYITLKRAPLSTYRLTEIETPEGYLKPQEPFEVDFNDANNPKLERTIENTPSFVKITKIIDNHDMKTIEGSEFELYRQEADKYLPYEVEDLNKLKTDGKIIIDQLPVGEYMLKEIATNSESLLNTSPLYFKVEYSAEEGTRLYYKNNGNKYVLASDNELFFINYQGSVSLHKVNEKKESLAGALFNLYQSDEKLVKEGLMTDASGKIKVTNLSPGSYYFKEISAPEGYIRNETVYPFDIAEEAAGQPETVVIEAINYQGAVSFRKVNEAEEGLSGISFDLFNQENEQILTVTSDKDGYVSVDGLAPGTYTFRERKAKEAYLLNLEPIEFEIPQSEDGKVSLELEDFVNYQGKLLIQKLKENDEVLANVHFELYDQDKNLIKDNLITDKKGQVLVEGLAPGTYYIKEVVADAEHLLEEEIWKVQVSEVHEGKPDLIQLDIKNYQASVSFRKVNIAQEGLAQARFGLYDQENTLLNDYYSDENGLVFVDGLAPGSYTFKELEASDSYLINRQAIHFEVKEKSKGKLHIELEDFINYQGSVSLHKVNEKKESLAGAVFNLYQSDEKLVKEGLMTDASGKIKVTNLSPGSYYFKEVSAPEGYIRNETVYPFDIAEEAAGQPDTVLIEAINHQAAVNFKKVDVNGQSLSKVKFGLYDASKQLITEVYSDEKGEVLIEELAPGKYYFKELAAVDGYILNKELLEFSINESHKDGLHITLADYINYQGSVSLQKKSELQNPLSGVIFDLYYEDELYLQGLQTDELGQLFVDGLAPGFYYFKEVQSVDGHLIDNQKIKFEIVEEFYGQPEPIQLESINYLASISFKKIDENHQPVAGSLFALYDLDGNKVMTTISDDKGFVIFNHVAVGNYIIREEESSNYLINSKELSVNIKAEAEGKLDIKLDDFMNYKGQVRLEKKSENGQALTGILFDLYTSDHQLVAQNLETNQEGEIYYDGLLPGSYYFKEVATAKEYLLNERLWNFDIADRAEGKPESIHIEAINYQASVSFKKVNEQNEALAQVEFALYQEGELLDKVYSDEDGFVFYDGLAPGNYYFEEVKSLDDYLINKEKIAFSVKDSYKDKLEINLDDFINYQAQLEIHKIDPQGNYLKEAYFEITSEQITRTEKTNNGILHLENLAPGTYFIKELRAPEGYVLDDTVHRIMIPDEEVGQPSPITITIVNKKVASIENTPDTSASRNYLNYMFIYLLAILFILINRFINKKATY